MQNSWFVDTESTERAKSTIGLGSCLDISFPQNIKLVLTDPPYGMAFRSNMRTEKHEFIAGDSTVEEATELLRSICTRLVSGGPDDMHFLVFTGWRYEPDMRNTLESCGLAVVGSLVWNKTSGGMGDLSGTFAPAHERIIHAVKGRPLMVKRAPDTLTVPRVDSTRHPTEKPRGLLRQLILATTQPGDLVVDPFAGTGSALVSAILSGRDAFGTEIHEPYYNIALRDIADAWMVYKPPSAQETLF